MVMLRTSTKSTMIHLHWMTAVIGLHNLKEGLQHFCDDVVKDLHATIMKRCTGKCNKCKLETLQPNHNCEDKKCPLGYQNCNCRKTNTDLIPCPKGICGVIYDEIINLHGSTPPAPNWKNTNINQWCTNPWAVATCFIPTTGYFDRKCGAEFDCSGLLLLIINNKAFLEHLECHIDGNDPFSQAYKIRNELFHSSSLELKKEDAHRYIDDMIKVLQDQRELVRRQESIKAVEKLNDLKQRDIHTELDVGKINNLIETDEHNLIPYLRENLTRLRLETLDQTSRKRHPGNRQKRKLSTSVAEQEDKRILLKDLASQVQSMSSEVASIAKHEGESVAKDFEMRHGVYEAIETDQNQALRILVVLVEELDLEIKKLKQANKRNGEKRSKYTKCYPTVTGDGDISNIQTHYEMPTISRPREGRLITLEGRKVQGLLQNCEQKVLKGGFGEVYISSTKVPGLDVRVVIKKIVCANDDQTKMLSISNEKIASRVMHFAIVPLIAYMDEELEENRRAFYFISPYFENGSLLEVIAEDKQCSKNNDIHLSSFRRKRILFQIASALDYFHTPVLDSRGIVLHMDLSSTNIVLDKTWNARLIDFGLGREMNEGQSGATYTQSKKFGKKGYWPTDNYSKLRVYDDYYNFGVVTRELITGKAPYIKDETELRKSSENIITKQVQKNIWTDTKEASILIKLSTKYLKSRKDKNVSSANIVEDMKKMFQNQSSTRSTSNTGACDLCIVNPSVEGKRAPPHQCSEGVNVCTSCMRNSHVNPIRCPTCNETVFPIIGHTYAAVLIAGNDDKNEGLAKSFRSDVLALKDVLSSKCPCVIGISDENIKMIAPSSPGKTDKLNAQVHEAFRSLQSRQNLGTLLVYFTGHYIPDKGFILGGPDDVLTLTEIQDEIRNIYTQWETARIFMFLDCCKAPYVLKIPELHVKMIQINACRPDESCSQSVSGSKFMKFFCQALTRRAYNKNCYNSNSSSSETECEDCVMSGDIITVQQLLTNISKHMNKCFYGKDPILYVHGITSDDSCIGYNVDFVVNLEFMFKEESGLTKDVVIKHKMFCDIKSLKEHILDTVLAKTVSDGKLKLTPVEFSDAVALHIHDGSQHGVELRSMQKVSWALDGKREIVACYRKLPNILKGLVVVFIETTYITEYLSSKGVLVEQEGGMKARFSFEELDSRYKDIENEIDDTSSEMSEDKKDALSRFLKELLKVTDQWEQADDKDSRELKIFFPRLIDNKWHDFMIMDLSVCQNS